MLLARIYLIAHLPEYHSFIRLPYILLSNVCRSFQVSDIFESLREMKEICAILLAIAVTSIDCYDYSEVIEKSLLFYEAQRSGKLPASNRITWRGNSMLEDKDGDIDLTGGYFDGIPLVLVFVLCKLHLIFAIQLETMSNSIFPKHGQSQHWQWVGSISKKDTHQPVSSSISSTQWNGEQTTTWKYLFVLPFLIIISLSMLSDLSIISSCMHSVIPATQNCTFKWEMLRPIITGGTCPNDGPMLDRRTKSQPKNRDPI